MCACAHTRERSRRLRERRKPRLSVSSTFLSIRRRARVRFVGCLLGGRRAGLCPAPTAAAPASVPLRALVALLRAHTSLLAALLTLASAASASEAVARGEQFAPRLEGLVDVGVGDGKLAAAADGLVRHDDHLLDARRRRAVGLARVVKHGRRQIARVATQRTAVAREATEDIAVEARQQRVQFAVAHRRDVLWAPVAAA
mmetsp:Transcript_6074/g.14075  ORF Transcript_6074/g.14075 Transcript_6074/m.14075 type:complete len:200 (+) Transcript_6074:125-724(+)